MKNFVSLALAVLLSWFDHITGDLAKRWAARAEGQLTPVVVPPWSAQGYEDIVWSERIHAMAAYRREVYGWQ